LVEELVLKRENFDDKKKKWLKKYSEAEGLDYLILEDNITDFVELFPQYLQNKTESLKKVTEEKAKKCYITDKTLSALYAYKPEQQTITDVTDKFPVTQVGEIKKGSRSVIYITLALLLLSLFGYGMYSLIKSNDQGSTSSIETSQASDYENKSTEGVEEDQTRHQDNFQTYSKGNTPTRNDAKGEFNASDVSKSSIGPLEKEKATESFAEYINRLSKSPDKRNIAITITDRKRNIASSLSSSIAGIYSELGFNAKTGLLRSSFLKRAEYAELMEGNSDIIEKMDLGGFTDHLALGVIDYVFRDGTLVDKTYVCTASLKMSIISTEEMSIVKSFTISENANGATQDQAMEGAIEKVINKYYNQYAHF